MTRIEPGARTRGRRVPVDLLLGLAALLILSVGTRGMSDYHVYVLTIVVIFAVVGASHVMLFGAAGQPSLGHAALLGAGAYAAINVARDLKTDVALELVVGVAVCAVLGGLIGVPSLRVSSLYLAIATLALSMVGQQVFYQWSQITGGGAGIAVPPGQFLGHPLSAAGLLYASAIFAGLSFLFARNVLKGRTGRAWNAIRTSPTAASSVGIWPGWQKIVAFAAAGALVGGAGVLYANAVSYIAPENFTVDLSIVTIVIAVVGGQRYLWGAVLGSLFVEGMPELLRSVGNWRDTIYGAVFIGVMIFFPGGLAGGARSIWLRVLRLRTAPSTEAAGDAATGVAADATDQPQRPAPTGTLAARHPRERTATDGGAQLEIDDVRIVFGGVTAVGGVSATVTAGEVAGLVGPNGAGKTTLLNAISGFVTPAGGSIRVDGQDILRRGAHRRTALGVARTFQNLNLHHGLTVLDHVLIGQHSLSGYTLFAQSLRLPRFLRGEARMRRHAFDVLDALQLTQYAGEEVENLSYGIQKRVDVARAVASSPRLLLLDEPAAGLTPQEGNDLVDRVLELAEGEMTVVLVEHNIDLVMRVADRVVALDFGNVIVDDVPSRVRVNEEFVRSYLGA